MPFIEKAWKGGLWRPARAIGFNTICRKDSIAQTPGRGWSGEAHQRNWVGLCSWPSGGAWLERGPNRTLERASPESDTLRLMFNILPTALNSSSNHGLKDHFSSDLLYQDEVWELERLVTSLLQGERGSAREFSFLTCLTSEMPKASGIRLTRVSVYDGMFPLVSRQFFTVFLDLRYY